MSFLGVRPEILHVFHSVSALASARMYSCIVIVPSFDAPISDWRSLLRYTQVKPFIPFETCTCDEGVEVLQREIEVIKTPSFPNIGSPTLPDLSSNPQAIRQL